MKLGPVTTTDKRNTEILKNYDEVISANCDVIVFFPIYSQFAAIRQPHSGRVVYKTYVFINSNLLSYKT